MTTPIASGRHHESGPAPRWSALEFSGPDSGEFLQAQLTQDLSPLMAAPGAAAAGWCSAKGRLRGSGVVIRHPDRRWWFVVDEALAEDVLQGIRRYILRARVDARILGSVRRALLVTEEIPALQSDAPGGQEAASFESERILIRAPRNGPCLEVITASAAAAAVLPDAELSHARRTAAGIADVHAGTVDAFLPQMLNMDLTAAVSFHKGCYPGQEIVARTQNLGRIKRRLLAFTSQGSGAILPGQRLQTADGSSAGVVAEVASTAGGVLILAVTELRFAGEDLRLEGTGREPLNPAPLPYPIPELADHRSG